MAAYLPLEFHKYLDPAMLRPLDPAIQLRLGCRNVHAPKDKPQLLLEQISTVQPFVRLGYERKLCLLLVGKMLGGFSESKSPSSPWLLYPSLVHPSSVGHASFWDCPSPVFVRPAMLRGGPRQALRLPTARRGTGQYSASPVGRIGRCIPVSTWRRPRTPALYWQAAPWSEAGRTL